MKSTHKWTYYGVRCTKQSAKGCSSTHAKHVSEFQHNDPAPRESFALEILTWKKMEKQWTWNILWTDEAHFFLIKWYC